MMRIQGYDNVLVENNIEYDSHYVINQIINEAFLWIMLEKLLKTKKVINAIYCYDFKKTVSGLKYCRYENINILENMVLIEFNFNHVYENSNISVISLK